MPEFLFKLQLYQKRDSDTAIFLWILRDFQEHLFHGTTLDNCFNFITAAGFLLCNYIYRKYPNLVRTLI